MSKEQIFWNWFQTNEVQYVFLNQVDEDNERERLLDVFLNQLHTYCDQLFFEIGGHPDDIQDLIITAEGDSKYFEQVERLVGASPQIENWNIIAFKPVREGFSTQYNTASLDPKLMWFIPLNNKDPQKIALRIYSDNYDQEDKTNFLNAAYLVLDNVLGEKSNSLDIGYIEMENSTTLVDKDDLIEIVKLPRYIQWHKSKLKNTDPNP